MMKKLLMAGAAVVVVLFVGSIVLSFASLAFHILEIGAIAVAAVGGYRILKRRGSKRLGAANSDKYLR
ncbi:hypothetical protein SAMN02745225_00080 [Ferrithrix thermotolerans DSM 19514]|uniref:Uncharacterized protein n=1 Tax=Ferrithrix thermotolerans DSM 19514 TaxID=1121881 RepID=A0A1M4S5P8_9ACTN|nr:hypothetical protein [Ferrithrix thermotolerans]SHE27511.1 hypothetical protein SAMN02745225_00080 [Ferrithrix thermotolerans DSM 19514]